MKKRKIGSLVINSYLLLLFGCGSGGLIAPKISSEPVELSVIRTNDGVGFINQDGQVVIKAQFTDAKPFSDGLAAVEILKEDGKKRWGFINHKGEFVIQPQYRFAESFSNKLALVSLEGELKHIFVDQRGNVAIKPKEDWIFLPGFGFSDELAPVGVNGKFGFINPQGEITIEPKFDDVRGFSDGLAFVKVGAGYEELVGYIDKSGKLSVPLEYKGGTDFAGSRALVTKGGFGGSYILIDKTGNQLKEKINPTCSNPKDLIKGVPEGLLPARLKLPNQTGIFRFDGCGYIDLEGGIAIPPNSNFQQAEAFSEGLAAIQIQGKWGYIDKKGLITIEPTFEEATPFTNGLAFVKVNAAKRGYINRSGKFIWQPITF